MKYKVTVYDNVDNAVIETDKTERFTIPDYVKTGYTFHGLTDGTYTYTAGSTIAVKSELMLTTVWTKDCCIVTITGLYDDSEASEDIIESYAYGETFVVGAYERDDYVFKGLSDGNKLYKEGTEITLKTDLTLTATWAPSVCTVTVTGLYYGSEMIADEVTTVDYGDVFLISAYERDDCYFIGLSDGTGNIYTAGTELVIDDDITLTAEWTQGYQLIINLSVIDKNTGEAFSAEDYSYYTLQLDDEEAGESLSFSFVEPGYHSLEFNIYDTEENLLFSEQKDIVLVTSGANAVYEEDWTIEFYPSLSLKLAVSEDVTGMNLFKYLGSALSSEWDLSGFTVYIDGEETDWDVNSITASAGSEVEIKLTGYQVFPVFHIYNLAVNEIKGSVPPLGLTSDETMTALYINGTYTSPFRSSYLEAISSDLLCNNLQLDDLSYAFYNCTALTGLPDGLLDGCSAVTTFASCFRNCTALENLPDGLFDWCSAVTSFTYCFNGCSSLTELPEGLFDECSAVTDFSYCFYNCKALTSLPEWLFEGCSSVTTFARCFYNCTALENLPEGLFFRCTSVKNFSYCFYGCTSLATISEYVFYKCTSVTSFAYCFYGCSSLVSLPEGMFDWCSAVTSFAYCFSGCSSLSELPEGLFDECTAVETFTYCFNYCTSLKSIPLYLFLYNTSVTNFSYTFYYCSSLTPKVYIGSSRVTSCSYFAYRIRSKGDVYVPSGSSTYTYFNRSIRSYSNSLNIYTF